MVKIEVTPKMKASESLPDRIAVCPNCGAGGPGILFGSIEVVLATAYITVNVADNDKVETEYEGGSNVEWDSQMPAQDVMKYNLPRYCCYECGEEFDEFNVVDKEEFAWTQMLEEAR